MLRRWSILLACLLAAGCAKDRFSDYSHSANSGIALVGQAIVDAKADNLELSATAKGIEAVILRHQLRTLDTAQASTKDADKANQAIVKAHWQFVRDSREREQKLQKKYDDDHTANKYVGWWTRATFWWIVGISTAIWAVLGTLGIIASVLKWTGPASWIFRALPLANVFTFARDRIMAARGQQVNVVVSAAPPKPTAKKR